MNNLLVLDILLHDKPIGTITHLPGDKNLFSFNQEYIDDPSRPTLSLSFKDVHGHLITDPKTVRTRVLPFFSNLLPEGYMGEYLASHAKVNSKREFYLLTALGKDLPGALKAGSTPFYKEEGALRFSLAGIQLKFSAIWETLRGAYDSGRWGWWRVDCEIALNCFSACT